MQEQSKALATVRKILGAEIKFYFEMRPIIISPLKLVHVKKQKFNINFTRGQMHPVSSR
jgi:hypothetical protein